MEETLKKIAELVRDALKEVEAEKEAVRPSTDFMPLGEAAKMLKVSKTQIMRLHDAGVLRVHKLSARKLYLRKSDLEDYLARH
jgi:excisionase family DNA binding protein